MYASAHFHESQPDVLFDSTRERALGALVTLGSAGVEFLRPNRMRYRAVLIDGRKGESRQ